MEKEAKNQEGMALATLLFEKWYYINKELKEKKTLKGGRVHLVSRKGIVFTAEVRINREKKQAQLRGG